MIGALMDAVLALYEWDLLLGTGPKHKGGSHKCLSQRPKLGGVSQLFCKQARYQSTGLHI